MVALFDKPQGFPDWDFSIAHVKVPANVKPITLAFGELAPGYYAVGAYHDANANNALDTHLFGYPAEGYALSNGVSAFFAGPRLADAAFPVKGDAHVTLYIQYYGATRGITGPGAKGQALRGARFACAARGAAARAAALLRFLAPDPFSTWGHGMAPRSDLSQPLPSQSSKGQRIFENLRIVNHPFVQGKNCTGAPALICVKARPAWAANLVACRR